AFSFAALDSSLIKKEGNPWNLLNAPLPAGKIPAIADQTVMEWGLGKKLGDSLFLTDDLGNAIELQLVAGLANSIFQGYVLIAEENFLRHFPSTPGFKVFLADHGGSSAADLRQELNRALVSYGVEITDTAERLAGFNTVQNTYLSIFLLLGGLGLMLSTIGLGISLSRSILERRGELALMSAVGVSRTQIQHMIIAEYAVLLLAGTLIGAVAGLIAVLPVIALLKSSVPFGLLAAVLLGIALTGLVSLYTASRLALSKYLLPALRPE
ncbi:hypothetical protein JW933_08980, partial [candidate division FCPU426 bacterium]|nr:hypothetical protein [candidate division FCPU426 bacterium]